MTAPPSLDSPRALGDADKTSVAPSVVQLRDAKTGKPCFGSHFRSFMAPKMGRASVPAESAGAGLFRHIRVAVFDSKRDSLFFRRFLCELSHGYLLLIR